MKDITFACPAGPFLLILAAAESVQVEAGASISAEQSCFKRWDQSFECDAGIAVSDLVGNRHFRSGSMARSNMLTRRDTQFANTSQEEAHEYTHRWKLPQHQSSQVYKCIIDSRLNHTESYQSNQLKSQS